MLDAFVEGARSLVQPCQLVIVLPATLAVLAARARPAAVIGAVGGIVLGGWWFTTRWLVLDDGAHRLTAVLVGVAVVALAVDRVPPLAVGPAVGGIGLLATTWWRPCVGPELGEILTRAPDEPWGQLFPTAAFMLGLSLPVVLVGLAVAVWRPSPSAGARLGVGAAVIGVLFAGALVAGRHGDIVDRLVAWSQ